MASFGNTITLDDGRKLNVTATETTHRCPLRPSGLTPCCERAPFELPYTDRMTLDDKRVTCGRSVILHIKQDTENN